MQEFVDRERIGGLSICGRGSFPISAANIDLRMKAIATLSMYNIGAVTLDGLWKSQSIEQRKEIIAIVAQQRCAEVEGGEVQYTGSVPNELTPETKSSRSRVLQFLPDHAWRIHS